MAIHSFVDDLIVKTLTWRDTGSFGTKEKILLFKELSYLLKGGVSLVESMELIINSSDNYALKDIARQIFVFLKQGKPLSYAMNRMPDYFDEGDYAMIKAGEASGTLPLIFQSLATEYVYMADIKNKYVGAMIYPIILMCVAFISVIVLFAFVLPSIFSIADGFTGVKMPFITQMLRDFSMFLKGNWQSVLWGFGGIGLFGSVFFSTESGKRFMFSVLLSIPLLGQMTRYFYLVKWARYTKLMLSSGMNYIQTFQLLRDILGISIYQSMIERVISGLQRGETIYSALQQENEIIPSDVAVLIKVGEETANLDNAFENILQMYDTELNILITRLAKVIEPVLLVAIGGIVVVIALGVFGLIFQIMDGAGL